MEDIDQATLDNLVDALSKPQGSDSIKKILEALRARMATLSHTITEAQAEGRNTYTAFRAMGGGRYLGFESDFKVAVEGEVIAALPEGTKPKPIGTRTRGKYKRSWTKLDLDPAEVAAFAKLVEDEFGRLPSYAAIAHYFGVGRGTIGKFILVAQREHGMSQYRFGQRTPPGFDSKVARRFGTYELQKNQT